LSQEIRTESGEREIGILSIKENKNKIKLKSKKIKKYIKEKKKRKKEKNRKNFNARQLIKNIYNLNEFNYRLDDLCCM
jgi:fructose-1,6-bisphosphatase